jgi:hypothetical protein
VSRFDTREEAAKLHRFIMHGWDNTFNALISSAGGAWVTLRVLGYEEGSIVPVSSGNIHTTYVSGEAHVGVLAKRCIELSKPAGRDERWEASCFTSENDFCKAFDSLLLAVSEIEKRFEDDDDPMDANAGKKLSLIRKITELYNECISTESADY